MSKTLTERAADIAQKAADKKATQAATLATSKPEKGKKLTAEQRLDRLEKMLGIVDE